MVDLDAIEQRAKKAKADIAKSLLNWSGTPIESLANDVLEVLDHLGFVEKSNTSHHDLWRATSARAEKAEAEVARLTAAEQVQTDLCAEACLNAADLRADNARLKKALENMLALTNRLSLHTNDFEFVRQARAALAPQTGGDDV